MNIDVRQASHPDAVRFYDTALLRRHFLIDRLFVPGEITCTYTHVDRMVIGGAMPIRDTRLTLRNAPPLGQPFFLARREAGILNVGGPGRIVVDGTVHEIARRDCLYVGMGVRDVAFETVDPDGPAKFYLLSAPAHATHPTRLLRARDARHFAPGDARTANRRNVFQYVLPGVCDSCQLVMGLTELEPGNVWNTMPTHTHDRRSEAYLYIDLPEDQRVVHLMGEPHETRHLLVANEQAILSPPWSIHSGVGTSAYAFVWGMAGDNMDYNDMDAVATGDLR